MTLASFFAQAMIENGDKKKARKLIAQNNENSTLYKRHGGDLLAELAAPK